MDRAYAWLHVKSIDDEAHTFAGIASTPELDRQGHSVDPRGVTFRNPIPLLLFHDQERPIGHVTLGPVTADGIGFTATFADVREPGALKARIDEARQAVKARLITAVSIGYRLVGDVTKSVEKIAGGVRLLKTEIFELSLVTIPANAHASILLVKQLAASGPNVPRVEGSVAIVSAQKGAHAMTTAEQIASYHQTRATKAARMVEIMSKSAEKGVTLDENDTNEYDKLKADVGACDAHLTRLGELEALQVKAATPITRPTSITEGSAIRASMPVITVKANVPPGTAFMRAACATLVCKGNFNEAAEYAKRWDDSTPEVALYLKAAVAAGNTTDAAWAGPLVNQGISQDFLELLRPATILGKIPGLRQVPFNTKVPSQTAGGAYGWVGEAKPKPVTKLAFSSDSLGIAKAAGIIILTEELVRLSNPSAEQLCRQDMIAGIAQFLDQQFIDPAVAPVAGVSPGSITNGAPTAASSNNPLTDILSLITFFSTANIPMAGLTFIMSEANAMALAMHNNSDGSPAFPGVTINGGSYKGINVVTSSAAAQMIIGVQPSLVLYADDGGVTIDASREASIQMDSAPAAPPDATTVFVSLWQANLVGLRAERFINWKRANANAVKYLTAAVFTPLMAAAVTPHDAGKRGGVV